MHGTALLSLGIILALSVSGSAEGGQALPPIAPPLRPESAALQATISKAEACEARVREQKPSIISRPFSSLTASEVEHFFSARSREAGCIRQLENDGRGLVRNDHDKRALDQSLLISSFNFVNQYNIDEAVVKSQLAKGLKS